MNHRETLFHENKVYSTAINFVSLINKFSKLFSSVWSEIVELGCKNCTTTTTSLFTEIIRAYLSNFAVGVSTFRWKDRNLWMWSIPSSGSQSDRKRGREAVDISVAWRWCWAPPSNKSRSLSAATQTVTENSEENVGAAESSFRALRQQTPFFF